MSVIRKMRKQTAVWWARSTDADRFGQYTFGEPEEIECRWDDTTEEFLGPQNETLASRAVVYVPEDLTIKEGDRLMLGEIDSNTPDDPLEVHTAHAVKRVDRNPNFRNTETLVTCFL